MTKELPADAHLRCSGRTHLQLTRVFPYLKVAAVGGKAAGRSHNAQTCLPVGRNALRCRLVVRMQP